MAKFLKSIFNTTEKRKLYRLEGDSEEDKADDPPLDGRRKLSISRSGRLKQANRKRHSLSLELYGENNQHVQLVEKPKSVEYHVHTPVTAPADLASDWNQRRRSADDKEFVSAKNMVKNKKSNSPESKHRRVSAGARSVDEEIDSAFEIIDKS